MAKIMETVLYYNPGTPETMKHVTKLKSVLVRMGIRIRNIGPDQVNQTVGYLAGVPGFEENADAGEPPVIGEEMLALKQFSSRRIDELLLNLRKAGVPRISLKAVLTEHNCGWTFYALYEELREEHEKMSAMAAPEPAASAGDPAEASAGRDSAAVAADQDSAALTADQDSAPASAVRDSAPASPSQAAPVRPAE